MHSNSASIRSVAEKPTAESLSRGSSAENSELGVMVNSSGEQFGKRTCYSRPAADHADLVRVEEAARILCVSSNTVRRWADARFLKTFRINSRGDRRLVKAEVQRLAEKLRDNNGYI